MDESNYFLPFFPSLSLYILNASMFSSSPLISLLFTTFPSISPLLPLHFTHSFNFSSSLFLFFSFPFLVLYSSANDEKLCFALEIFSVGWVVRSEALFNEHLFYQLKAEKDISLQTSVRNSGEVREGQESQIIPEISIQVLEPQSISNMNRDKEGKREIERERRDEK